MLRTSSRFRLASLLKCAEGSYGDRLGRQGALSEANGRSLEVLSPYCWFVSGGKKAAMAAYMAAPTPEARRSFLKMLLSKAERSGVEAFVDVLDARRSRERAREGLRRGPGRGRQ